METICLKREFGAVKSDAEKENGKNEGHVARDCDACDAGRETTDTGLKLDFKVPYTRYENGIGSGMA